MTYAMGQLWKHRAKWHLRGLGLLHLLTDSWVYILKSHTLLSEHYFLKSLAVASSQQRAIGLLPQRVPTGMQVPFGHKAPESLGNPG